MMWSQDGSGQGRCLASADFRKERGTSQPEGIRHPFHDQFCRP